MLEAQGRRDSGVGGSGSGGGGGESPARGSGDGSGAYLRSSRAFEADGTPNRPTRRCGADYDAEDGERSARSGSRSPVLAPAPAPRAGTALPAPLPIGLREATHREKKKRLRSPTPPPQQGPRAAAKDRRTVAPRPRSARNYPVADVSASLPVSPKPAALGRLEESSVGTGTCTGESKGKRRHAGAGPLSLPPPAPVVAVVAARQRSPCDRPQMRTASPALSAIVSPGAVPMYSRMLRDGIASPSSSQGFTLPPAHQIPAFPDAPANDGSGGGSSGDFLKEAVPTWSQPPTPPQPLSQPSQRSRSRESAVGPYHTPEMNSRLPMPDRSGFLNLGNDCYACSVLTLLLRSLPFRAGLLAASPTIALCDYTDTHPGRISSGYWPGQALRAPRRPGGRLHRLASLSPPRSPPLAPLRVAALGGPTPPRPVRGQDLVVTNRDHEPVPSVHGALNSLCNELWLRESMLRRVNYDRNKSEEDREAILDELLRRWHRRSRRGSPGFFRGVSLSDVAALYRGEFFTGEQEDAHEFFVSLLTKLEREAEAFEKRRRAAEAGGGREDSASPAAKETATDADDSASDYSEKSSSSDPSHEGPFAAAPPVWVNSLVQGKLLNVVRCCNPECGHHIASEETYVNLSVTIPKPDNDDEDDDDVVEEEGGKVRRGPPTISQLLRQSLQYGKLDEYVCDSCKSCARQYQGACFYAAPPPLLMVQLKRFAIHGGLNSGGVYEVTMTKDRSRVRVEEMLEVYSLPGGPGGDGEYFHPRSCQLSECLLGAEQRAAAAIAAEGVGNKPTLTTTTTSDCEIDAVRTVYQLRGSVLHLGQRLTFGHYVAQFATPAVAPERAVTDGAEPGGTPLGLRLAHCAGPLPSLEEIRAALPEQVWRLADDGSVRGLPTEGLRRMWEGCDSSYLLSYEKVFEERACVPVWKVLPVLEETEEESSSSPSTEGAQAEEDDADGTLSVEAISPQEVCSHVRDVSFSW